MMTMAVMLLPMLFLVLAMMMARIHMGLSDGDDDHGDNGNDADDYDDGLFLGCCC